MNETAQLKKLLHQATRSGSNFSMSVRQYRFIAEHILSLKGRVLIVGAGSDTPLWFHCSKGNLTLVENDPRWIPNVACKIIRPKYEGRVGVWLEKIKVPRGVARPWDVMLVDGPTGYSSVCIGRQEPIAWAARFGRMVFVHDYNRAWERKLCDHYLGAPEKIVPFKRGSNDRLLAVFDCSLFNPQALARKSSDTPSRSKS